MRVHPLREEALEVRVDHAIVTGNDEPRRLRAPGRDGDLFTQGLGGPIALRGQQNLAFGGREIGSHQVSLRLELADSLPSVLGDRVQLQQVIINIVINGIQAMDGIDNRARSLLIRSTVDESNQVVVSVHDTGNGIDTENTNRLFQPFYTTKSQGTGMGLSICRSIIEAHGGHIGASNHNGAGATFYFALPSHRAPGRDLPPASAED